MGALGTVDSRGAQLVVAVALAIALGAAGRRLALVLRPEARGAVLATTTLLVAWALLTTVTTALGLVGWLRPAALFVVAGALGAAAWLAPPRRPRSRIAAMLRLGARRRPASLVALAAFVAAVLAPLPVLVAAWDAPFRFAAHDDLSYHLPAAAVWLCHGDLRMLEPVYGDPASAFYPIAGELVSWALLAPFDGLDVLARWTQLPFAVGSLFAVAAVARRLGVSRAGATAAALVAFTSPRVFPELALGAGNDHALAFAGLAAVEAALALRRASPRRGAVLLGVALGAMAGTKYLGLLLAPLPLAIAVAALAGRGRRPLPGRVRTLGAALTIAAAVALLVGGHTYLRNLHGTGNPLFPAPLAIAGDELLPGWEANSLAVRSRAAEAAIAPLAFLLTRTDLFGPLFRWTLLPACLLAPLLALARRRPGAHVLALATPLGVYLVFLYLTFDHRDLRYALLGLQLAGVAAAFVVERALGPRRGGVLALVATGIALPLGLAVGAATREAVGIVAAAALGAAAVLLLGGLARRLGARRVATAAAGLGLAVAILGARGALRTYERARENEPIASLVDQLTGGSNAVIAYAGFNLPYPLFGSHLQHDVHLVPRDQGLAGEYWDWGSSPEPNHQGDCCRQRWLRNLDELGVELVFVSLLGRPEPERVWLRGAQRFTLVHESGEWEIWRREAPISGTRSR